jgi:gliding motility-associated-like protein
MSVAPRHFARTLMSLFVLLIWQIGLTQPIEDFDRTFGGDDYEEQNALIRLPDGFLLGGNSRSSSGTGEINSTMFGNYDFFVVKTDFDLQPIWQKSFGGGGEDWLRAMIPTADGGFLAAGYSNSGISGVKSQQNRGNYDFWVVRFDAAGQLIWEKTFGGTGDDECYSILEMPDRSGFLLGGFSNSPIGFEKSENTRGDLDFWLIRIDNAGQRIWDKTLGGPGREQFHTMLWASDGNLILSGGTSSASNQNEVGSDPARGSVDFWMVKYSVDNQQVMWNHRYGGYAEDFAYSLLERRVGGGFLLGGTSKSAAAVGGNCSNCKRSEFYGDRDFWLVETDSDGKMLRDWSFGGTGLDVLYQIKETPFDQILVAGVSDSPISGSKTASDLGNYDFWTIFLDKTGKKIWEQTWGGEGADALTKVIQNPDGSFLLAGHSDSPKGLIKTEDARGKNDFWLVKTFCDLTTEILTDTIIKCGGVPISIDATVENCATCEYRWKSGETEPILQVLPPTKKMFEVLSGDLRGCLAADSLKIELGVPPIFELGKDTVIFTGNSMQVGVENPNAQFSWSTGDTTNFITVAESGIYVLTVTDPSGCTMRDYVRISVHDKKAVYIPNIFTPDFDGKNDYFFPFTDRSVVEILQFRVFDRWGSELFSTNNISPNYAPDGWDGTFRNHRVNPDTYYYFINLKYDDGEIELFKGSINVER